MSQIENAKQLAKGKIVSPCVSIQSRFGEEMITRMCPFLDSEEGCQMGDGFIKNPGKAVECPEGNGTIIIHSGNLSELKMNILTKISDYAQEIAIMEPAVVEDQGRIEGLLFT